MPDHFIATCDVGTTSVRCFIYKAGKSLTVISCSDEKIELLSPKPGYVEVNPSALWKKFLNVIKTSLANAGLVASQLTCIGITTQRSTFTVWDKRTGQEVSNFITWNDLRAMELMDKWNNSWMMKSLRLGSSVLYYLSRSKRFLAASILKYQPTQANIKLKWVLENNEMAKSVYATGNLCFGTLDCWLVYKLTSGKIFATDPSNASGTAIFDPYIQKWSSTLINLLSIRLINFPEIRDTNGDLGHCSAELFGAEIPITAVVSDQGAALFGGCGFEKGDVKITLGTGAFLDINCYDKPHTSLKGIYTVIGWRDKEGIAYMAEGATSDVGTIIDWGKKMGFYNHPSESSAMAEKVSSANGIFFIPCFQGIQAPVNDAQATGGFLGISTSTTPEHLVRAMLEAIAFRVYQILKTMKEETKYQISKLRLDGGVSQNDFLLQTISTLTNLPIEKPDDVQTTSLGCCFLTGLGAGVWQKRNDVRGLRKTREIFQPQTEKRQRALCLYHEWERALSRFTRWYPKDGKS